jgi:membrane protein YdbS with pleckstrin-like domain
VVTIQKHLTLLRQWRIRSQRWLGLSQWLLWIPVTLVMLGYWLGFDLWAHSPATVCWFLATGIVGLFATLWLMYWSPSALRKRVGDYLDDNSTGFVLKRAQRALDEIAHFERE